MSNKTVEDLETSLAQFHGTERYYYDPVVPELNYTDGVKFVFDSCIRDVEGVDIIPKDVIRIIMKKTLLEAVRDQMKRSSFISISIKQTDKKIDINISDGDGKNRNSLSLNKKVFLTPEIKMFCTNNVLMLASEY